MSRIVFMGTPDFAVPSLKKVIETQNVVGVVTQPDRPAGRGRQLRPSPIKQVALDADIPLFQPKSLRKEESATPLREWQPDLIIVAAFGQILRPHVLDLPPLGCLNVHASLLPRWRGASPIQHAILAGDAETGITLMKMDVGLDTGPMYVKESVAIVDDETAVTLHDKLADLGAEMMGRYLDEIVNGRLTPIPQNDEQSTYAPMISKEDGRLDWQESANALDRRIRAMTPWPGATTTWQGKGLKIIEARPVGATAGDGLVGLVCGDGETAVVETGNGRLQLHKIQLAGKRAMSISDFLRGRPEF
ncbi:MAG: methionyl-tRNA formyltransferase, partial [Chloroflexi bacterium]